MANKKTPAELRVEAKKLLDKACEMENRQFEKAGKLVKKHVETGFTDFSIEVFKQEAGKIFHD